MEKLAEAERLKIVLEAEANAEALALKGEAEAFAMEAKARAEAQQMAMKAEVRKIFIFTTFQHSSQAWREYKEAAMVDMMMQVMPKVAAEISGPMSQVKKVTMVSTGDGPVGAGKVTGEIMDIMSSLPDTVRAMTGVDISQRMIKAK